MQYSLHILLISAFVSFITARPEGAPACDIGAASVQEQHLQSDRDPKTGSLEFGKYQTVLDGTAIITVQSDPTFANLFQPGVENTLSIQSGPGSFLKGLLVIASGGESDEVDSLDTRTPKALVVTDSARTQLTPACSGFSVSSITHNSAAEKRNVAMTFQWPTGGQKLFLDVNIVKTNNSTSGSEYYHTQYPMQSDTLCDPSNCGLLKLGIFCPLTSCGLIGRLLGLCNESAAC